MKREREKKRRKDKDKKTNLRKKVDHKLKP